ncbi:hypothetical protein [Jeotgalibaca porci]|uniref:hypothetical protein n=1 Tax=Jeotgalibaca porci TaxID=1868793 RepID=UPI00359F7277
MENEAKFINAKMINDDEGVNVTMEGSLEDILTIYQHVTAGVHYALVDLGLSEDEATKIIEFAHMEGVSNSNVKESEHE